MSNDGMKIYLAILISFLATGLFGQTIDSLGLDDNPQLTKYESDYFNKEFKDWIKDFDFTDKKIAFLTGSTANKHLTKTDYFNEVKSRLKDNYGMTHSALYLKKKKKLKSGYDAIVVSWVKLLTDKRRRQIMTELSYKK